MYRAIAIIVFSTLCAVWAADSCDSGLASITRGAVLLQEKQRMSRTSLGQLGRQQRVAILINGVVDRFVPLPLLERVVKPATQAGHIVDYYVQLVRGWNHRWSDTGNGEAAPEVIPLTDSELVLAVTKAAKLNGARSVSIEIGEEHEDINDKPNGTAFLGRGFSYPTPVSRNVLRKFKSIEGLWKKAQNTIKANIAERRYDWVVLSRDDSVPLANFDLASFDDRSKVYVPACGLGTDPTTEPNDHMRVVGGDVADKVMMLYTDWLENPSIELTQARFAEHFLKAVMETKGVAFEEVEWMPYYDGVFELENSTIPRHCARKPCHPLHAELPVHECVEGSQRVPTPHRMLLLAETLVPAR